jgi:hypothetical protein
MPITYDPDKGTWKLYEATEAETDVIVQIAAEHLCQAFGAETTQKIMNDAAAYHKANPETSQAGVEMNRPPTLN